MTHTILHWIAVICQVVGAAALLFAMGVFALAACWMASAESARRRRERELCRDAEDNINRAAQSMRFISRYGEGFHAYGVELRPGPRTRRTLASLANDPLHRTRVATPDELMPYTIEIPE